MRRNLNKRYVLFYGVGVALLCSAGYLIFELGRYQGGYSLLDQRREQERFQQLTNEQLADAEDLRRQITLLQMSQELIGMIGKRTLRLRAILVSCSSEFRRRRRNSPSIRASSLQRTVTRDCEFRLST